LRARSLGGRGSPGSRRALGALEAAARNDPADAPTTASSAGWFRYLIASDSRGAFDELTLAAQSGPAPQRALAYAGLGEIAEDRTDSLTATGSSSRLLQAAPTDPIAELAALRLLDLEGESPQVDDLIAGAARALKPRPPSRRGALAGSGSTHRRRSAAAASDPRIESDAWRAVGGGPEVARGRPVRSVASLHLRRAFALDGAVPATAALNDSRDGVSDGDVGLDLEPATATCTTP